MISGFLIASFTFLRKIFIKYNNREGEIILNPLLDALKHVGRGKWSLFWLEHIQDQFVPSFPKYACLYLL